MKFLNGLTLNLEKLPKYTAFTGDFTIEIDKNSQVILMKCLDSDNKVFNKEIKERIESILQHIKVNTNKVIVKHNQRLGIGRFYPDNSISLISLSRHVKHTIFKYMNWIDIDMVKGHPTILHNLFKGIYELTTFKRYIENTDEVFNELLDYYSVDETLNKDDVKNVFNIAIYGGSYNTWLREIDKKNKELKTDEIHPFIRDFINECNEISSLVFKANPNLKEKMKKYNDEKNEWKLKSSVMSYFCQSIENEILHIAYKFLIKQNILTPRQNVELEYDGLCFKMPCNITIQELEITINNLNDKIVKETGFNVKFKIKPYNDRHIHQDIIENTNKFIDYNTADDEDKTIPDNITTSKGIKYYTDTEDVLSSQEYINFKLDFEKQYFKLEFPLLYGKENEEGDLIGFYKKTDMPELLADKTPNFLIGTPKRYNEIPFYNFWKNDTDKRRYEKIVFEPNPELQNDKHYNMFKGFKNDDDNVEPICEEDSYFFKLLKHLCENEPEFYDYFKALISHIIQKPYIKSKVAIVFYSHTKGVGKDSIIEGIKALLGIEYFGKLNDIEDINKKFNDNIVNKFMVYGEEITANAKKMIDKLKEAITRTTCNLEKKGIDAISVNDYSNYFFTTNGKNSFKIEQGCRRLGMVECKETKLSTEFYTNFYNEINDNVKIKQLFKFFKIYKQNKYSIGKDPVYNTSYKMELENESKAGYIQFLYKNVNSYGNMTNLSSTKFYEMSKEFCNKNYISSNYTITEFGKAINQILLKFRGRKSCGYIYNFTNSLDLLETLYKYDANYYRYINNLETDFIPHFRPEPEIIEETEY